MAMKSVLRVIQCNNSFTGELNLISVNVCSEVFKSSKKFVKWKVFFGKMEAQNFRNTRNLIPFEGVDMSMI